MPQYCWLKLALMPATTEYNTPEHGVEAVLRELPDLSDWESRPETQMIPEKIVVASPTLAAASADPAISERYGGGAWIAAAPLF
jgi:hypothetical protein